MRQHPALMTMRILWFALFAATFIYMGVAYGVPHKTPTVPQNPTLHLVFGGVSLVLSVMSFLMPRMTYQQAAKSMNAKIEDEVVPNAFPDRYRQAMPKRAVFAEPKAAVSQAFMSFQTPFILSLALSDAVALFGLMLALMGFDKTISLPFFLVSAVLVAIRFPTQANVLRRFERVYGASFPAQNG